MTTAYTLCRESRDKTLLSSLSNAIAPNKSSLMADRIYLTSSTKVQMVSYISHLLLEYQLPPSEFLAEYDITLGIDVSKLPKTQKIGK